MTNAVLEQALITGNVEAERRSWWRRLLDFVFGYDFFISYSWRDGGAYAGTLARRLEASGFEVFLDRTNYAAGDDWKKVGAWTLRRTGQLILVGSPHALTSPPVLREVEIFSSTGRRIVPIDFGGSLEWSSAEAAIARFLPAEILRIKEPAEALGVGPTEGTVSSIRRTFTLVRQDKKRVRGFAVVAALLGVLAIAAAWFGYSARSSAQQAIEQRNVAEGNANRSLSLLLSSQSRSLVGTNDQRALLLAVEAVRATAPQGYVLSPAQGALQRALSRVSGFGLSGHRDTVTLAAFNGDSSLLATGSFDGEIRVWNISDPNKARTLAILQAPQTPSTMFFDSSSDHLITFSETGTSRTHVLAWPLNGGHRYPTPRRIWDSFSPHSALGGSQDLFAIASMSGEIQILSRSDLRSVRILSIDQDEEVVRLLFSNDGKALLAGTRSSKIFIWDLSSQQEGPISVISADLAYPDLTDERAPVDILGINDDKTIIFGGSSKWVMESTRAALDLRLWRLNALEPVGAPFDLSHRSAPNSSAIHFGRFVDGGDVVTVTLDGRIRRFRLGTPSAEEVLSASAGSFIAAADVTSDSSMLAIAADNEVHLIQSSELAAFQNAPNVVRLAGFDGSAHFVLFEGAGRFLVAGGLGGTARLWDLREATKSADVIVAGASPYSPAEAATMSEDGRFATILRDRNLEFWNLNDLNTPLLIRSVPLDTERSRRIRECLVCTVLVAPGWRWVAIQASEDDKAQVVELTSRARDFYVDARVWRNTQEVEFSADGRWLLVRHGDESEYMYDLATNSSLIQQTRVNLPPGTYSRTFSANGRYVLFARYVNEYQEGVDRGRTVGVLAQLDAVNDSSTRREISGFATGIGQAAFSTDGSWLAVAGDSRFPDRSKDDNAVKVFSTRDPQVRDVTLEGHEFAVGLQFSPDGRWLLTASSDMTLRGSRTQSRLWRLRTEGVVATPVLLPDVVTYLHAVQFSPDGRFLVTISGAGPTGRLWRLAEQVSLVTTLTVPKPRNNWYYRIVFSNNSDKVVISGWDDPTPLFWRPSSDRISAAGTAILNGDREIQQMHFTESGEHLVILNSGKTTTGVSGSSGSHITVVDFRRFPQYGSIYAAVDSDDEVRAVSDRLNFGLLLTSGASLRAWSVDVARMLRQAEGAVGRNLTLDEWVRSELLGSYRPTFSRYPVDAASLRALPTLVGRFRAESPRMADALADRVVAWANQLDEADVCNDVAWAFVLQRNGRAAAQAIECALRHFPLNDEYRDTRGAAFALLGRRNEAIADFTFYVDAQRDNSKQAESVARRLKWIDALRMRVDPFVNGIE